MSQSSSRLRCPIQGCATSSTIRRELFRHINAKHAGIKLSDAQLRSLRARHCSCGRVLSQNGSGPHVCIPEGGAPLTGNKRFRSSTRSFAGSQGEGRGSTSADNLAPAGPGAANTEPGPSASDPAAPMDVDQAPHASAARHGSSGSSGNAGSPQGQSSGIGDAIGAGARTHYAAQTVHRKARSAFSEICTEALRRVHATKGAEGQERSIAQSELILLPSRLLRNSNSSKRRYASVLGSIRRYKEGEAGEHAPLSHVRHGSKSSALRSEYTAAYN